MRCATPAARIRVPLTRVGLANCVLTVAPRAWAVCHTAARDVEGRSSRDASAPEAVTTRVVGSADAI
jgi:hypothetical protein